MHGIRIWHLAALALSVPFLTAAVPSGCTGGLNPSFRQAIGQDAGTGIGIPRATCWWASSTRPAWPGALDVTIVGRTRCHQGSGTSASPRLTPTACRVGMRPDGRSPYRRDVWVPDQTGVLQQATITTMAVPYRLSGQRPWSAGR